ncbi:MAG: hypothetical protein GY750_00250 [Lentisphaerae bacterium]|nr:hypothetical protein [Lentisphaerota bacterium]MCP4099851.1 hypothetical protein [Lentisphaerota bacterium]
MMRAFLKPFVKENGQATAELCVAMVAIVAIFLGIIVISGLGISNIRMIINAKTYAEYGAHNTNLMPGAGTDIYSWDYGQTGSGGDGLPFTVDDQYISFSGSADATVYYRQQFESATGSESGVISDPDEEYEFSPVSGLGDYAEHNYVKNFPEMFASAAGLISSSAPSNIEEVFTLSRDQFSEEELRTISRTFYALFGTNLNNIDLRSNRSNIVYMPASR